MNDNTPRKRCSTCHQWKAAVEFYKNRTTTDKLDTRCIACKNRLNKENYAANRDQRRRAMRRGDLRRRYDVTEADYQRMVGLQGDCCGICGTPEPLGPSGTWHIDHCHATGRVRGLLCNRCNMALGLFQEDEAVLAAAIKWLRADVDHRHGRLFDPGG